MVEASSMTSVVEVSFPSRQLKLIAIQQSKGNAVLFFFDLKKHHRDHSRFRPKLLDQRQRQEAILCIQILDIER